MPPTSPRHEDPSVARGRASKPSHEATFTILERGDGVRLYTVVSRPGLFAITWVDTSLALFLHFIALLDNLRPHVSPTLPLILLPWIWAKLAIRRKESLLVIQDLGLQLSSRLELSFRCCGLAFDCPVSPLSTIYLPVSAVADILLLEGIQGWSVIWYLAIVEQNGQSIKIKVPFETALPRLPVLRIVWAGVREILFHGESEASPKLVS